MSEILNAIKRVILASGKTRYRIAKESGVSEAQLSKLMNDKVGLNVETIERLAEALDLEIAIRRKRRGKQKR